MRKYQEIIANAPDFTEHSDLLTAQHCQRFHVPVLKQL